MSSFCNAGVFDYFSVDVEAPTESLFLQLLFPTLQRVSLITLLYFCSNGACSTRLVSTPFLYLNKCIAALKSEFY